MLKISPGFLDQSRAEVRRGMDDATLLGWCVHHWLTATRSGMLCLHALCLAFILLTPLLVQSRGIPPNWPFAGFCAGIAAALGVRFYLNTRTWDNN